MAITGVAGRYLTTQLPRWQLAVRAQAEHYARLQCSVDSLLDRLLYWVLEMACHFVSGTFAGFLGGYASHLVLDALTPCSLPLVGLK